MEELLSFLQFIATKEGCPLREECIDHLRAIIKVKTLKVEEHLLMAGEVCRNLYFIKKGLLRCYYILHGQDVSDWFFAENEAVVAVDSYYDQVPSEDYIQALEYTEVFYITHYELNEVYRTFLEFNVVGRVLTNKYLRIWHRQARDLRMLSSEERYQLFLTNHSNLVQRVQVQYLASYLDMSRETLSRRRGTIIK